MSDHDRQAILDCLNRTMNRLDPNQIRRWFASRKDYERAVPAMEQDARYYRQQLAKTDPGGGVFSLQITDRNGHSTTTRELSARTWAEAWDAYTEMWDNDAIASVELWRDGIRLGRTEHKLAGTPEAYRVSV